MLDRLARTITHEVMADAVIRIEGHADSRGPADYNLTLSERRALAVQRYLHQRHNVSSQRIPAVGKGEMEPFDQLNTAEGINRRVEFHYVGRVASGS